MTVSFETVSNRLKSDAWTLLEIVDEGTSWGAQFILGCIITALSLHIGRYSRPKAIKMKK